MRRILLAASMALFFGLMSATGAGAQTMRVPTEGQPALMVDIPAGWRLNQADADNAFLVAPDSTTVLQLSMISGADVATTTLAAIAASIFKSAGAEPYSRSQPGSMVGRSGEIFFSRMTSDKGVHATVVAALARLDPGHVGAVITLTADGATPAQTNDLEQLKQRIRLAGAH